MRLLTSLASALPALFYCSVGWAQSGATGSAVTSPPPSPTAPSAAPVAPSAAPAPIPAAPSPASEAPAPGSAVPADASAEPAAPASEAPASEAPASEAPAPGSAVPASAPAEPSAAPASAPPPAPAAAPPAPAAASPAAPSAAPVVEEYKPTLQIAIAWDLVIPINIALQPSGAGQISSVGIQGLSLELKYWAWQNWAVGGLVSWHTVGDKRFRTVTVDDATVSGTQAYQISSNEILGRLTYSLTDRVMGAARVAQGKTSFELGKVILPYAAVGFGGARVTQTADWGFHRDVSERWQFALAPEVGVELPTKAVRLIASARLQFLLSDAQYPSQTFATVSAGAAF
jgi:hypothetical protein